MKLVAVWSRGYTRIVDDEPSMITTERTYKIIKQTDITDYQHLLDIVNHYQERVNDPDEQVARMEGGGTYLDIYLYFSDDVFDATPYNLTKYLFAWILDWGVKER